MANLSIAPVGPERLLLPVTREYLCRRQRANPSSLTAMRRRIVSYVSTHVEDPELSIDAIAAAIGCSRRYLHKAFGAGPETLSEMIWRLRLERCARNLRSAELAKRTITEIAFASGFNSSQHFSRLFKTRYGMAPRDWRKRHQLNLVELSSSVDSTRLDKPLYREGMHHDECGRKSSEAESGHR